MRNDAENGGGMFGGAINFGAYSDPFAGMSPASRAGTRSNLFAGMGFKTGSPGRGSALDINGGIFGGSKRSGSSGGSYRDPFAGAGFKAGTPGRGSALDLHSGIFGGAGTRKTSEPRRKPARPAKKNTRKLSRKVKRR